jgi:hypothetical protein
VNYKGFPIFQANFLLDQVDERMELVGLRNYKRSCWAHMLRARTLMQDAVEILNR